MAQQPLFFVTTYGCQMNVHDSEKLANLLYHAGLRQATAAEAADVLVINTCSIREKAENQLYSDLGQLGVWKQRRPGRVLGVGGCVAQQVGDRIMKRFPQVDFVFGTHNVRLVPSLVTAALEGERAVRTQEVRSLDRFELPPRHADYARSSPGQAFVTVMEGCDMFCSFCIVPTTRGREISRPVDAVLSEAERLVASGVREITLLGQTVNAYGRHEQRSERTRAVGTVAFDALLRRLDAIPSLRRIRYTSPHPLFFDDALVRAHAELESLCPHVHLPLQSGSNRVLQAMRRRYTREDFARIAEHLRSARSDIALTTDLIVGFPGESEDDFEQTLALVRELAFVDSYSFKYSARPGTPAAGLPGEVEPREAQRRLAELQRVQRELTIDYHRSRVGRPAEMLLEGPSRRGAGQLCGRDPYHRTVNLQSPEAEDGPPTRPGQLLMVDIIEATPHSLIGAHRTAATVDHGNPQGFRPRTVKLARQSADETERSAAQTDSGARALRVIG